MLRYAIIFLLVAIIAAVCGFTGIAGTATNIAYVLALICVVFFFLTLILGRRHRERAQESSETASCDVVLRAPTHHERY